MRLISLAVFSTAVAAVLAGSTGLAAELERYVPSSMNLQTSMLRGEWHGRSTFPGVYCIEFPEPGRAVQQDFRMYANNAITYSRVMYEDRTAAYIVTSTLPALLTPESDVTAHQARSRKLVETATAGGIRASTHAITTPFGSGVAIRVDNVAEGDDSGPFPLVMPLLARPTPQPVSMSTHRLFARGGHRYEVAVLGAPDSDPGQNPSAELETRIEARAESILAALITCMQTLPPSARVPE